jgi:hypothetical protein
LVVVAVVAVVAVAGALGLHALWTVAKRHLTSDSCTVAAYELDPDQAAVASTMVGAVTKYPGTLPERAAVLVLAAGLQESKLTNLPPGSGDRDSVGVLQQRPSQGWGHHHAAELTDVGEATKEFIDALVKVPDWRTIPLADAVQAVQISADGTAYTQHEPEARALADALLGRTPKGISCTFGKPTRVAPAATVARQATDQLGISTPTAQAGTVRVAGAGWQTAAWFVANADRLGIEKVSYAGQQWTRTNGWTKSAAATRSLVVATMSAL